MTLFYINQHLNLLIDLKLTNGGVIADYTDMLGLAEDGSLMGSIRWEGGYANMPINQQLSECNINLLQKWIDDGFPE